VVLGQGGFDVQVDDGIAAQHQGRFVKKAAEILDATHAAGRTHGARQDFPMFPHAFVGVADLHTPAVAIAKVVFDLPVVERHVDHDLLDPVARQVLDDVLEHRFAEDGHHRLGRLLGQGAYPGSLPGCQDHCFGHVDFFTRVALLV